MKRKIGTSGFRKRNGNVAIDVILIIVILFILAVVSVMGYRVFTEMNTDMQADLDLHNISKEPIGDLYARYPSTFDNIFMLAFMLLWLMLLVSVYLIDTKPIFFAVMLIVFVFVFIAMMYLNNTFEDLLTDEELTSMAATFPMSYWVLTHLLPMTIIIGFSALGVMYAKTKI